MGVAQYISTVVIFAGAVLLLIPTISSPIIKDLAIVRVNFRTASTKTVQRTLSFGALGYCSYTPSTADTYASTGKAYSCSSVAIGYNVTAAIDAAATGLTNNDLTDSNLASKTLKGVSNVMVLFPVAAGLSFLAFLVSAFSKRFGFLFSAVLASLAWVAAVVAFIVSNVVWSVFRANAKLDNDDTTAATGFDIKVIWDLGLKLTAAAVAALTIGVILSVFSCCCGAARSLDKKRGEDGMGMRAMPAGQPTHYYPVGEERGNPMTMAPQAHDPFTPQNQWSRQ